MMQVHERNQVARTILAQLGGSGKLEAMIGAWSFASGPDSLSFRFSAKSRKGWRSMVIKLEASDTYTVTFVKVAKRKGLIDVVKNEIRDVCCDNLKRVIEGETGLPLSL